MDYEEFREIVRQVVNDEYAIGGDRSWHQGVNWALRKTQEKLFANEPWNIKNKDR